MLLRYRHAAPFDRMLSDEDSYFTRHADVERLIATAPPFFPARCAAAAVTLRQLLISLHYITPFHAITFIIFHYCRFRLVAAAFAARYAADATRSSRQHEKAPRLAMT
jgi:hypothetical protein